MANMAEVGKYEKRDNIQNESSEQIYEERRL